MVKPTKVTEKEQIYLGLEINLFTSSLEDILQYLFVRMFQRERLVDPYTVGKGQAKRIHGTFLGKDHGNNLEG